MISLRASTIVVSLFFILSSTTSIKSQSLTEQPNQEIQNLVAFAKLYGHVKYFHPSDEASAIDWDTFAIYGAKEVKGAANSEELKVVLDSLFLPVAPTTRIRQQEPSENSFISFYLDHLDSDTTNLKMVAWQHLGVSLNYPSVVYNSIRVNRLLDDMYGLSHNLDTRQIAGKKLRLRAAIKTKFNSEKSEAKISIEVEEKEKGSISWSKSISSEVENASTPGYSSDKWKIIEAEIKAHKNPTAAAVVIGLHGPGTLWIDEVSISMQTAGGKWEPVPISNAGFEDVYLHSNDQKLFTDPLSGWKILNGRNRSQILGGVNMSSHSHTHTWLASSNIFGEVTDNASFSGRQSYRIEIPTQLFDEHPQVGETAELEIAPRLYSEVALALYRNDKHTLPQANKEDFENLKNHLKTVHRDSSAADDVDVRLADVIIAWNVFQHFYPYFDVINTDWEQQLILALKGALTDKSADDFFITLSKMLASLQDGHIWLYHPSQIKQASLPFIVNWIDDKAVVTHSKLNSIKPGDIIVSLNGLPAGDIVRSQMDLISGSSQLSQFRSLRFFGAGKPDSDATVEVKQEDGISTYTVSRVDRESSEEMEWSHLPVIGEIEDDIYYVSLSKASMSQIGEELEEIAVAKGVIFDLRGYPNSNHQVINYLLTESVPSNQWRKTPKYIYPDQKKIVGYEESGWNLKPSDPHIQGKVVFLTDARAVSYAEAYLSFIEHYSLADIVGQSTGGVDGVTNLLKLPGGYISTWTGERVLKLDGSQHHLIGIQPTVPVRKTIGGVREGRDEFLETALEIIR